MNQDLVWIEKVQTNQPAWLFLILFVLVGFFAWIRIYYRNLFAQTLQASANFQMASRMFMDNSVLQKQLDQTLYVLYIMGAGLLLYIAEKRFRIEPYGLSGLGLFFFNILLLSGLFLSRLLLVSLSGYLFNSVTLFREYMYNTFIYNKLIGVTSLPLLWFLLYTRGTLQEVFQWSALAVVLVILIMREIRGVVFSFRKDVRIFYIFLYLCGLELVPLALLYRWLEGIL